MADTLGPTQLPLGVGTDGRVLAWDWYRDPNALVGGPAGWGKTFACRGILDGMERAAQQGREGGMVVWNPKAVGYYAFRDRLARPEWCSDFRLSNVAELWQESFSPFLWGIHEHRMAVIQGMAASGVDEFRGAGFAPFTVVVEEMQATFQVLAGLPTPKGCRKPADAVSSDLDAMTALFRASGIRFVLVSQAMTSEGGISTKTKNNCTAKLFLGPVDDGGFLACFGQSKPPQFARKYRPVLGSGIFQCPDLGTRVVQVKFE